VPTRAQEPSFRPSVASAAGLGCSAVRGLEPSGGSGCGDVCDYVQGVIELYVSLPGTPERASRGDRRLARALQERRVPLPAVKAAFVLAIARRTLRSPDAPLLGAIRTLHYFVPVIEEVLDAPLDPGYVQYLTAKLRAQLGSKKKVCMDSG
jgi:hypothetical protein